MDIELDEIERIANAEVALSRGRDPFILIARLTAVIRTQEQRIQLLMDRVQP
jgi:hypothetical protein